MLTSRRSAQALAEFQGVDRRFQQRGAERGITVIDDYGHHPTEIRATLAAARAVQVRTHPRRFPAASLHPNAAPDGRLRARAFTPPTRVFVLDIYAASEKPIAGVTAEALVDRMKAFGHRGARIRRHHRERGSSHCRIRTIRRCRHDSRCRERVAGRRPDSAATSRKDRSA